VAWFLGHHPHLVSGPLIISRAQGQASPEGTASFFEHYTDVVKDVPPVNIWNYDEINFLAGVYISTIKSSNFVRFFS
jgi:hypothetical protein